MVLADFGLARTAAERLTSTGQALGTPLYMSPEQVMGRTEEVDGRADVYGLGATMYEVLTGRPLFQANEPVAILRMILKDRPDAPSAVKPGIDKDFENIVLKSVEKLKGDRYQTAGALRDDLAAYAAGGVVAGRPVSSVRHGLRGAARWWAPALAACVLVAAGLYAWTRRPASLSVHSYPEAQALIDGKEWGRTPIDASLPPGKHELVLRADGFRELARTLTLDAGGALEIEPVLTPTDIDDPKALAALATQFQVEFAAYEPPGTLRAVGVRTALPLFPRGAVRVSDAAEWSIEVGDEILPGGRIEFRAGGRVLSAAPFDPAKTGVHAAAMPSEVADALAKGEEIEWGYVPASGEPVLARFARAKVKKDGRLDWIARVMCDQPGPRRQLTAKCLLDAGLDVAAYREAAAHCAERKKSARGWAVAVEALRRMGLEESRLFAEAREGLAAAPPAAERGTK
jgi:hypothetical protein